MTRANREGTQALPSGVAAEGLAVAGDGLLGARVACTEHDCPEEAEFDVIETVFGVDLPGRPVCAMCAYAMGMKEDDLC